MKKVVSLLVVVLLLMSVAAADVLLPNGAVVGMSMAEVEALEGRQADQRGNTNIPDIQALWFVNVRVCQYDTARYYYFIGDNLIYIAYTISEDNAFDALTLHLTDAYGEGSELTVEEWEAWQCALGNGENKSLITILRMSKWYLNDSTMICLMDSTYESPSDGSTHHFAAVRYSPVNYVEIIDAARAVD